MLNQLTKSVGRVVRAAAIAAVIGGGIAAASAQDITGACATFPGPIYTKWGEQYKATGAGALNYQAVGSGAGVTQIINRTVDFGASDTPVASERLASNNLLQFPAVIGAVVVVVNIPGVDGANLKLNGAVIADIYQGRIRMWNAKEIKDLNPGVTLPAVAIAPAYRADSSGTTNIFTSYLASVSLPFQTNVGAGNSVPWKTGVGAPGNAGVAAAVKNTKGGIGYVEYAYATENGMQAPMLENRAKKFVKPTVAGFNAAASQANWNNAPNMAASMLNMSGDTTWPIVSATYVLVPKNPSDPVRAANVLKFFDWAFKSGGPAADQLHYIALPKAVQDQVRKKWTTISANGQPVWK
ncbi:MAG: phosphate ABC transporter substrate-binding protein PstS [Hyphomonadaceae bacterium]|nr:phosphate ABC transporter substrate-binding protein PstS [Hyphomonadaceae bacterium]